MARYWEDVVSGDDLKRVYRRRKNEAIRKKVESGAREDRESKGWEFEKALQSSNYIWMSKRKEFDELFEDKVWSVFYRMGFSSMNDSRDFRIMFGSSEGNDQQVDVFAMDEEVALVIECKSTPAVDKKKDFKLEILAFAHEQEGIRAQIRKRYGNLKVKFIWATENITVCTEDRNRLDDAGISLFDESAIAYYSGLADQLGQAAKYQLLGYLFADQKVENMESTVPAIRGNMGGHTYYSFSIEPERLLKIGYVLHRSDANDDLMPTYQRLIKRSRIKQIGDFIRSGGYFPNSIIISIDTGKKGRPLRFDIVGAESDSKTKLGILYLPKKYRSAYIIDGQHRLHGYSGSQYSTTNTVPVVAFENLDQKEQLRLFMDINQNQKAVPKRLRNTLEADLLYDSDDYSERREALRLHLAIRLGEDKASPLYDRILVGENQEKESDTRCISVDIVAKAIDQSGFLTKFKMNKPDGQVGLLDTADGDNKATEERIYSFLLKVFGFFKTELPDEWEMGRNHGLLSMNNGIYALICVAADVLRFAKEQGLLSGDPAFTSSDDLMDCSKELLKPVVEFYANMSDDARDKLTSSYGGNGPVKHRRYLEKAIHDGGFGDFLPDGYEDWWANNSEQIGRAHV